MPNPGLLGLPPGYNTQSNRGYYAELTQTATQSITSGSFLSLQWLEVSGPYNPSGLFTLAHNTRITFPEPGLYTATASFMIAVSATGDRYVRWLKNGLAFVPDSVFDSPAAEFGCAVTLGPRWWDANDYLEVQAKQDSGGPLNVTVATSQPRLWVARL